MKNNSFLPLCLLLVIGLMAVTKNTNAQITNNLELPTSINEDGAAPDSTAILDVQSTAKGMLIPRMTTAQRTDITGAATGLLVFDTDTGGFWFYNGTDWTSLSSSGGLVDADGDTKIHVEKNADEDIIRFDVRGSEAMQIDSSGRVGIGTTSPSNPFEVATEILEPDSMDVSITAGSNVLTGNLWQSFTAGPTGDLVKLQTIIWTGGPYNGTLYIYEGEGMGGTLLHSQPYGPVSGNGWRIFVLDTPVRVTTGEKYTFRMSNARFLAHPNNPYPGGRANTNANYDYSLRTFIAEAVPKTTVVVSGNRVGIANTNPMETLDVGGNVRADTLFGDGSNLTGIDTDPNNELITSATLNGNDLEITDAGGTTTADLSGLVNDADADPNNELISGATLNGNDLEITDAGGTTTVDLSSLAPSESDPEVGSNTTNYLPKWNGSALVKSTSVFEDANGNVGFGINNPNANLDIKSDYNSDTDTLLAFSESGPTFFIQAGYAGSGANGNHLKMMSEWGNNAMTWRGNGNVGIGTTSPQKKLDVSGDVLIGRGTTSQGLARTLTILGARNANSSPFANIDFNNFDDDNSSTEYTGARISSYNAQSSEQGDLRFFTRNGGNLLQRMVINEDGKVSIGSTNSNTMLSITRNFTGAKLTLFDGGSTTDHYGFGISSGQQNYHVSSPAANHVFYAGGKNGNGTELMRIKGNGNVGIGTDTPDAFLDINAPSNDTDTLLAFSEGSGPNFYFQSGFAGVGQTGNYLKLKSEWDNLPMMWRGDGSVGIGTTDLAAGYKLSVDGKIACEEVMVDLSGDWPDYVFQKDYNLKSLHEVQTFIDENGHLPGVPSAQEVEDKGVVLGEMNKILMEKVEELTLYAIEREKEVAQLKADFATEIDRLEALISQATNDLGNLKK